MYVSRKSGQNQKYYRKISLQRYISFDELDKTVSMTEDTVEYEFDVTLENLCREKKNYGIKKALLDLSDDERQIVKECFYFNGSKKPSYSKPAEKYNISRQAQKRISCDKILLCTKKRSLVTFRQLSSLQHGGPSGIRTRDLPVMRKSIDIIVIKMYNL